MSGQPDKPRIGDLITRLGPVARHLADVLAGWWMGFDVTRADEPPIVPDDASSLTDSYEDDGD